MNEKNKKYLSIGMMSKLTGVHIKSLRYYDEIGILRPAYIDPITKYRYYSQQQMALVDVIQLCVELDIPLKKLPSFLSEDKKQINFSELLEYGSRLAREKIKIIREKQEMLNWFQLELDRIDSLTDSPLYYYLYEKTCWLEPSRNPYSAQNFTKCMTRILTKLEKEGIQAGYECGVMGIWKKDEYKQFIFLDVTSAAKNHPNILHIPHLDYLCQKVDMNSILKAPELFKDLFCTEDTVIAIEVENYTWNYDYRHPSCELRCAKFPNIKLPKIAKEKSCK